MLEFDCGAHYKFAGADRPRSVARPLHDRLFDRPLGLRLGRPAGRGVTQDGPTYGMTLLDQRQRAPRRDKRERNVKVAMMADQER